jgi:hypothetical protein
MPVNVLVEAFRRFIAAEGKIKIAQTVADILVDVLERIEVEKV